MLYSPSKEFMLRRHMIDHMIRRRKRGLRVRIIARERSRLGGLGGRGGEGWRECRLTHMVIPCLPQLQGLCFVLYAVLVRVCFTVFYLCDMHFLWYFSLLCDSEPTARRSNRSGERTAGVIPPLEPCSGPPVNRKDLGVNPNPDESSDLPLYLQI